VSIRAICLCFCLSLLLGVPVARAEPPTVLVLGDSLSAAYGIRLEQGWVALLQDRLESKGYGHRVVNASASGETTGGALARLPRALERHRPAVVVIELGGNDGLRGLPIADVRANFEALVRMSRDSGASVLLIGMRSPPNYGATYTKAFHALFGELARSTGSAGAVLPRRHRARRLADARGRPAPNACAGRGCRNGLAELEPLLKR
jgi:acyl-CoA thioesterase-1